MVRDETHSSSLVAMHLMLLEQRMFVCSLPAMIYYCTVSYGLILYEYICQIISGHTVQCLRHQSSLIVLNKLFYLGYDEWPAGILVQTNYVKWPHKWNWVSVPFNVKSSWHVPLPQPELVIFLFFFFCNFFFYKSIYALD